MKLPLETLQELLDYHYDRRERLYDFLATLTPAEFTRELHVGWGSIRNTLVHCLEAETFWVQYALLKQGRPDFDFAQYPDIAGVRQLAAQVRERTQACVAGLDQDGLNATASITYSSGTVVEFTVAKLFVHVITHDTHHRGQVVALARQLGYEPPELDLM